MFSDRGSLYAPAVDAISVLRVAIGIGPLLVVAAIIYACTRRPEPAQTVEVTFAVRVPDDTSTDDAVFLTGDWMGWRVDAPDFALERRANDYAIQLQLEANRPIEFTFTRGAWRTVESSPDGFTVDPRAWTPSAEDDGQQIEWTVEAWADLAISGSTRSGRIQVWRLDDWPSPGRSRRIWTYLPPGYATNEARFPVLYMFDGQNVFDRATSFAGEWGVDETCEALIKDGALAPLIVVAIDNGGAARLDEYTPVRDPEFNGGSGGGGEAYLRALDRVRDEVNARYRTQPGPETTAIAGSSLGGLMALYAGYHRPEVFGRVAALSPSIWWADRWIVDYIESKTKPGGPIYIDMGGQESANALTDLRTLADALREQGFVDDTDLWVVEDPQGGHNEPSWRRRFGDVVTRLFPSTSE